MIAESRRLTKAFMGKKAVKDTKWINLRASWTEWKWENNLDEDDDRIYQADTGGSCF